MVSSSGTAVTIQAVLVMGNRAISKRCDVHSIPTLLPVVRLRLRLALCSSRPRCARTVPASSDPCRDLGTPSTPFETFG